MWWKAYFWQESYPSAKLKIPASKQGGAGEFYRKDLEVLTWAKRHFVPRLIHWRSWIIWLKYYRIQPEAQTGYEKFWLKLSASKRYKQLKPVFYNGKGGCLHWCLQWCIISGAARTDTQSSDPAASLSMTAAGKGSFNRNTRTVWRVVNDPFYIIFIYSLPSMPFI